MVCGGSALQMAVYGVGAQKRWRLMGATERRHIAGRFPWLSNLQ